MSALLLNIASKINYFSESEQFEITAFIIGDYPTIEERESIFSPQFTKYSRSFTLA